MLITLGMNTDSNRAEVAKEYFDIRILLTRNNRAKNEVSELVFELKKNDAEYFIVIKSNRASGGLRLATYNEKKEEWKIYRNDYYDHFYKYMFKKISLLEPADSNLINEELTKWLNRLWVVEYEK